jgi:hypothetical protein
MSNSDPLDLERIDREIRINEARCRAEEAACQPINAYVSEDCPPEMAESFYDHIAAWENAPIGCYFDELLRVGVELPPPDELDDAAVTAKLWEIFETLARMQVFFSGTDHLSDRELYVNLWGDTLREMTKIVEMDENSACHFDLMSTGEHTDLYLRYYADEETRQRWMKDFPDDVMPPSEKPPYDRDRKLPKAKYG